MRLGDLIPADCKMIKGETAKVDQSSLTGESLPVNKSIGDELYSGAALKEGRKMQCGLIF
jgi:H+-transporting ATPase